MGSTSLEAEILVSCPICGERDHRVELVEEDLYLGQLQVRRCASCGARFLSPRLTPASVLQVENNSDVYAYSPAQIETVIRDQSLPLVHWIPQFKRTSGRRWLDIGCNRGLLLEAARRQGWGVTGVEIASEAAARARADFDLTVYPSMDELPPGATYDVITAWHVLEHTYDPVAFLEAAEARLVRGGVIAIQVPSFDFVDEYRARGQTTGLLCSVHNFYFTYASLRALLDRNGLQILYLDNNAEYLLLTAVASNEPPRRGVRARLRTWLGM